MCSSNNPSSSSRCPASISEVVQEWDANPVPHGNWPFQRTTCKVTSIIYLYWGAWFIFTYRFGFVFKNSLLICFSCLKGHCLDEAVSAIKFHVHIYICIHSISTIKLHVHIYICIYTRMYKPVQLTLEHVFELCKPIYMQFFIQYYKCSLWFP